MFITMVICEQPRQIYSSSESTGNISNTKNLKFEGLNDITQIRVSFKFSLFTAPRLISQRGRYNFCQTLYSPLQSKFVSLKNLLLITDALCLTFLPVSRSKLIFKSLLYKINRRQECWIVIIQVFQQLMSESK